MFATPRNERLTESGPASGGEAQIQRSVGGKETQRGQGWIRRDSAGTQVGAGERRESEQGKRTSVHWPRLSTAERIALVSSRCAHSLGMSLKLDKSNKMYIMSNVCWPRP